MMPPSTDMLRTTLVLGGARSGKSRYAEQLLDAANGACVYIATAQARDDEMASRIREHQARRGANWRTVEQPLDLVAALQANCHAEGAVLVDCLTLWLANLMAASRDVEAETHQLVQALPGLAGRVVLVSNEVGQGIVPENAMAREFRDHAGQLNQAVAAAVDEVVLMTAGLAQKLKP